MRIFVEWCQNQNLVVLSPDLPEMLQRSCCIVAFNQGHLPKLLHRSCVVLMWCEIVWDVGLQLLPLYDYSLEKERRVEPFTVNTIDTSASAPSPVLKMRLISWPHNWHSCMVTLHVPADNVVFPVESLNLSNHHWIYSWSSDHTDEVLSCLLCHTNSTIHHLFKHRRQRNHYNLESEGSEIEKRSRRKDHTIRRQWKWWSHDWCPLCHSTHAHQIIILF